MIGKIGIGTENEERNTGEDEVEERKIPYEEMDFNKDGFMVITTERNECGECYTTSYHRGLLKAPCYGCGSEDHGFLSIYSSNGQLSERIGCILSPHETSI